MLNLINYIDIKKKEYHAESKFYTNDIYYRFLRF